jgi:anti-sigma-K factor RskA
MLTPARGLPTRTGAGSGRAASLQAPGEQVNDHVSSDGAPHDHPDEALPLYVLGVLERAEVAAVEAHLAVCPRCVAETRRLRATADSLALATEPVRPPPTARAAVLRRVGRGEAATPGEPAVAPVPRPRVSWLGWAAAAAAVALVPSWQAIQWHAQAQALTRENATLVAAAREQARALVALDPQGTRFLAMEPAGAAPRAQGRVMYSPGGRVAVIFLEEVPPPAPGTVYQLWLLEGAGPSSAGTVQVDESGAGWLVVQADDTLQRYAGVAVTIEPAPGRSSPSGPFVARATF